MVKDIRLRRVPKSFKYAARGIWHVLRTEQNIQIHTVATAVVVVLAILLHITATEWAILLLTIGLVLSGEILNTVVEDFLDIIHPEHHESVRRIKDAIAGAVLLSAGIAVAEGVIIFGPRIVAAL